MKRLAIRTILFLIGAVLLAGTTADAGTVTGRILMKDGTPMAGGTAIFFDSSKGPAPVLGKDFRPPDWTEFANKEGAFQARLNKGEYYVGGILWLEGNGPGPPHDGDSFFVIRDHTISVPENGLLELGDIPWGEVLTGHD